MISSTPPHEISYGSHRFNNTTKTVSIRCANVPDPANRVTAYTKYTITLREKIAPGTDASSTVAALRQVLLARGQEFKYKDNGIGAIEINTSGGRRDLVWGPVPTDLSIE